MRSAPEMQLISVVLPEPFGPIRPKRSPVRDVEADPVQRGEAAEVLGQALDLAAAAFIASRLRQCLRPARGCPRGAATTNTTSSTPTTSTFSSEEIVTVTTCCTVPSSTAPITGPIQCAVPPMIGIASALTA